MKLEDIPWKDLNRALKNGDMDETTRTFLELEKCLRIRKQYLMGILACVFLLVISLFTEYPHDFWIFFVPYTGLFLLERIEDYKFNKLLSKLPD